MFKLSGDEICRLSNDGVLPELIILKRRVDFPSFCVSGEGC